MRWPLWGVLGVSILVLGSALYRWSQGSGAPSAPARPTTPSGSGSVGASADSAAVSSTPAPAPSEAVQQKPKEPLYDLWRSAILTKNAQQVLAVERSFLGDRARFHDGLAGLAENDGEERVRSFSIRVLGKFAMAGDVDLFTRLLENDPSPYVRQNAAWALGELGLVTAAGALNRVSEGDPDKDVRAAAAGALTRIR
jgi:hypothetical protein